MSGEGQEQNRSEEATPFKLRRARERGQVARSMEVGFVAGLVALASFLTIAGERFAGDLSQLMRSTLVAGIAAAGDPQASTAMISATYGPVLQPLALFGGTVVAIVVLLELVQLRGFIFTGHPLKPDFSRLNPAKGLKRLFSMRMLKETMKSILKAVVYGIAATLVIMGSIEELRAVSFEGDRLAVLLAQSGMQLLFVFIAIAIAFAFLDQVLVRGEFKKQMKMSRREVTREAKDREGDPRIKQKRKQLHEEYAKQSQGIEYLAGSDLVVVNPEHYAVSLRYDPERMKAPSVSAKGRNRFALALRDRAAMLGIPVIRNPPLARALFRDCTPGREIAADHYGAVANLYIELRRQAAAQQTETRQ